MHDKEQDMSDTKRENSEAGKDLRNEDPLSGAAVQFNEQSSWRTVFRNNLLHSNSLGTGYGFDVGVVHVGVNALVLCCPTPHQM